MPELRLPITRKQHAMFAETYRQLNALQAGLSTAASTVIAGSDQDIPKADVKGVDDTDGVYQLVLVVPDPPKAPDVPHDVSQ